MKKFLLSVCAMFAIANSTFADDTFAIDDLTLPVNAEAEMNVKFSLDAGSTCSGYVFWLQLPSGIEAVTKAHGNIDYILGDSYDDTPTISMNVQDGYLKVACLNANSDPLNKQTGTLVTLRMKVAEGATLAVGDVLEATLGHATISNESGVIHNVADATFSITICAAVDQRVVLDENSTVAPELSGEAVNVRVLRTINAGEWSTICLPFAMTEAQVKDAFGDDVQIADFTGYETTDDDDGNIVGISVNFKAATAIEANHPYIIKVSTPVSEFSVDGVDIEPEDEPTVAAVKRSKKAWSEMIGTYVANTVLGDPEDRSSAVLFLSDNKFWYSVGKTKMKAYRAYFDFYDVLYELESAAARISMQVNDEATGVDAVKQLTVVTAERVYSLQGQQVEHATRPGIYVRGGKKIIMK